MASLERGEGEEGEEVPLLEEEEDVRRRTRGPNPAADPEVGSGAPPLRQPSVGQAVCGLAQCRGGSASKEIVLDKWLLGATGLCCAVFVVWVSYLVITTWPQIAHHETITSVRMKYMDQLDFPAITVCNMIHDAPLDNLWCGTYHSTQNCTSFMPAGMPHCLTFNNDLKTDSRRAERTGLADTLMIALSINIKQYPKHAKFSGVHINLHPRCSHKKGECPEELASSLMAAPGRPRFYRMKKIEFQFLNGTVEDRYEARDSDVGGVNFESLFGPAHDTVVLGFHYATMAETIVAERPHYTLLNLLSEIGGVMGLLFGAGIVTLVTSCMRYLGNRGDVYYDLTGRPWAALLQSYAEVEASKTE